VVVDRHEMVVYILLDIDSEQISRISLISLTCGLTVHLHIADFDSKLLHLA
jgi:hypothetical protein